MSNKIFHLSNKLLILVVYYFIATIIIALGAVYGESGILKNYPVLLAIAYVWIFGFGIYFLIYLLRYLTYHIKLEGSTLKEYGVFSKNRSLEVSNIQQVYTQTFTDTFILYSGRFGRQYAVISNFNLTNDKANPFPLYPVSPNLLEEVKKSNPQIVIDPQIAELDQMYNKSGYMFFLYAGCYFTFLGFAFVIAGLPLIPYVIYTSLGSAISQNNF